MNVLSLVRVRMGGRPCAIPCRDIVEVVPKVKLSKIPESPDSVLGVINLRGRVVPVLDVRQRLSDGNPVTDDFEHLVIMESQGKQIGLAVDEVSDVLDVSEESVETPGRLSGDGGHGIVRIDDELVLVVRPEDVVHAAP